MVKDMDPRGDWLSCTFKPHHFGQVHCPQEVNPAGSWRLKRSSVMSRHTEMTGSFLRSRITQCFTPFRSGMKRLVQTVTAVPSRFSSLGKWGVVVGRGVRTTPQNGCQRWCGDQFQLTDFCLCRILSRDSEEKPPFWCTFPLHYLLLYSESMTVFKKYVLGIHSQFVFCSIWSPSKGAVKTWYSIQIYFKTHHPIQAGELWFLWTDIIAPQWCGMYGLWYTRAVQNTHVELQHSPNQVLSVYPPSKPTNIWV